MRLNSPFHIFARFENDLVQAHLEIPDAFGNTKMLIYETTQETASNEIFDGIVYITNSEFQVYQRMPDGTIRTGIFYLNSGIKWGIKTPGILFEEAMKLATNSINEKLNGIKPNCFCQYPRILDYFTHRDSYDKSVLRDVIITKYLKCISSAYDNDIEKLVYQCTTCQSKYLFEYQERRLEQLRSVEWTPFQILGENVPVDAPSFLQAYFDNVYKRKSYIHRSQLYPSTLDEWINYLFEEKQVVADKL